MISDIAAWNRSVTESQYLSAAHMDAVVSISFHNELLEFRYGENHSTKNLRLASS